MGNGGAALMSIGEGHDESRARDAALQAVNSHLLDVSIDGAKGVLFNIKGSPDMTLFEINEAAELIRQMVDPEANIIFGAAVDDSFTNQIQITVIATGFDSRPASTSRPSAPGPKVIRGKIVDVPGGEIKDEMDIPVFLRRRRP